MNASGSHRSAHESPGFSRGEDVNERIPTVEDIRLALIAVGYTEDEAREGVENIKKRGIGIGHEMARESMQATIGGALREAQAKAWGKGDRNGIEDERTAEGWGYPAHPNRVNPYEEGQSNE